MQLEGKSGVSYSRALTNVATATTKLEKGKIKTGILATPEVRLAEAMIQNIHFPSEALRQSASRDAESMVFCLQKTLKPNNETTSGLHVPRVYLESFRLMQKQIYKARKFIATQQNEGRLKKGMPLVIKDITWPRLPDDANDETRRAVAELSEYALMNILKTVQYSNDSQAKGFTNLRFSNCDLADMKFPAIDCPVWFSKSNLVGVDLQYVKGNVKKTGCQES